MRRDLAALASEEFDLLILGGGITGAGVALDLATRQVRVALIDKGDFASGTSSVSSKLIHGGLRYLEHGDFALVYEALRERRRLLRHAPHLVRPLRFLLPFVRGARVSPWKWRTGLLLYDLLAGPENLRCTRFLSRNSMQRAVPSLISRDVVGGAEYYDAQMDDARLCLEVLQTAFTHGATLANYVEAIGFEQRGGVLTAARVRDQQTGQEFVIRSRQFLNATGPWVDAVLRSAGEAAEPLLQPTKGVHLVAPDRGLTSALLLLHPDDGRVLFVIPWLGKTLIGTTDTLTTQTPDSLIVTEEEIDYLLKAFNHALGPPLDRAEILNSFVGLRPLAKVRPGEPSSRSREFRVTRGASGLWTAAGGKYTTFRAMAEVIGDGIAQALGVRRPSGTVYLPLTGAPLGSFDPQDRLVSRYGRQAREVLAYQEKQPALARRIVDGEPEVLAEFAYQRDHEMALRTEDFLLRRTRLGLFYPHLLETPLNDQGIPDF